MEKRNYIILEDDYLTGLYYKKLYRIKCIKDFIHAKAGDLGGYIENYKNLLENGWIKDDAHIWGDAVIYGNALVCGISYIYGSTQICDNAKILNGIIYNSKIEGNCIIGDYSSIRDNSEITGNVIILDSVIYESKIFGNIRIYNNSTMFNQTLKGRMLINNNKILTKNNYEQF